MTREELAKMFGVSVKTLYNWEKEKPDLVRVINQGLLLDEIIKESKQHVENLNLLQKKSSNGKFYLK